MSSRPEDDRSFTHSSSSSSLQVRYALPGSAKVGRPLVVAANPSQLVKCRVSADDMSTECDDSKVGDTDHTNTRISPKLPPLTLIRSKRSGDESDMTSTQPPSLQQARFSVTDTGPPPTKSRQHIIDPNGVPISQLRRIAAVQKSPPSSSQQSTTQVHNRVIYDHRQAQRVTSANGTVHQQRHQPVYPVPIAPRPSPIEQYGVYNIGIPSNRLARPTDEDGAECSTVSPTYATTTHVVSGQKQRINISYRQANDPPKNNKQIPSRLARLIPVNAANAFKPPAQPLYYHIGPAVYHRNPVTTPQDPLARMKMRELLKLQQDQLTRLTKADPEAAASLRKRMATDRVDLLHEHRKRAMAMSRPINITPLPPSRQYHMTPQSQVVVNPLVTPLSISRLIEILAQAADKCFVLLNHYAQVKRYDIAAKCDTDTQYRSAISGIFRLIAKTRKFECISEDYEKLFSSLLARLKTEHVRREERYKCDNDIVDNGEPHPSVDSLDLDDEQTFTFEVILDLLNPYTKAQDWRMLQTMMTHRSRGLYRKTRDRVNESFTSVKSIPSSNSRPKRLADRKSPVPPPAEHAVKQELIDVNESSATQSRGLPGEEQDSSLHLQIDEDRPDVDDEDEYSVRPQLTNVSRGGDGALPVGEDEDDEQRMIDEDMAAYYLQSDDDRDSFDDAEEMGNRRIDDEHMNEQKEEGDEWITNVSAIVNDGEQHRNVADVNGVGKDGRFVYAAAIEQEEFEDDGEPVGDDEDDEYAEHEAFRRQRRYIDEEDTFSDETDEDRPSTEQPTTSASETEPKSSDKVEKDEQMKVNAFVETNLHRIEIDNAERLLAIGDCESDLARITADGILARYRRQLDIYMSVSKTENC